MKQCYFHCVYYNLIVKLLWDGVKMKDNYKVLGLDEDSSIDDVERTFNKLEKSRSR